MRKVIKVRNGASFIKLNVFDLELRTVEYKVFVLLVTHV